LSKIIGSGTGAPSACGLWNARNSLHPIPAIADTKALAMLPTEAFSSDASQALAIVRKLLFVHVELVLLGRVIQAADHVLLILLPHHAQQEFRMIQRIQFFNKLLV
jgi:hypothetical protein